jgi:phosphoglycerol transferase
MWLQFVCLGIGIRFLRFRRKGDLLAGALVVGATMVTFLAINGNTLVYQSIHGQNQEGLGRAYKQLELYALKLVELLMPPPQHRLVWLTDISRQYSFDAWVKGEMFSPYLGVVGITAFIWLFVEFVLCALNHREGPRRLPIYAPACLWVILYASIGGLNCLVGLFGLVLFRGSNRYSIFILAACLLFLVSRMSRLVRRWKRFASYALAAGVAALGLLDQIPLPAWSNEETALKTIESDRAYGQVLEDGLPHGAMVFQLPVMDFPESDPVVGCDPYDHLRPYIWTKTLRFSFGSVKGRTREAWQAETASLPPEQMVKRLEDYGFSAICINLKGFPDHGAGLLKALAKCGKSQLIEDDARDQACVVLNPSPNPACPHSDDAALIVFKGNWTTGLFDLPLQGLTKQRSHFAGNNKSSLYFINESPEGRNFHLTGVLVAMSAGRVDMEFEGRVIGSGQFARSAPAPLDLRLYARPGRNYLYFKSGCKPEPLLGQPQGIRVSLAIVNLQIIKDPPTPPTQP